MIWPDDQRGVAFDLMVRMLDGGEVRGTHGDPVAAQKAIAAARLKGQRAEVSYGYPLAYRWPADADDPARIRAVESRFPQFAPQLGLFA